MHITNKLAFNLGILYTCSSSTGDVTLLLTFLSDGEVNTKEVGGNLSDVLIEAGQQLGVNITSVLVMERFGKN